MSTATSAVHPSRRELKDRAHQLVLRGKLEAAAEVYVQLIAQDAKDPSLRLHHAELCDKLNRRDRAVASFQVAAQLFASSGHAARAHAALACGLRISPFDPGLRRAMNELRPPPRLTLVRQPSPAEDLEVVEAEPDEAVTEPNLIPGEDWDDLAATEAQVPVEGKTVCERPPERLWARTVS